MSKRPWASRLMMSQRADASFSGRSSQLSHHDRPMGKHSSESIRLKVQLLQLHRATGVTDQYALLERHANLARPLQISHPDHT